MLRRFEQNTADEKQSTVSRRRYRRAHLTAAGTKGELTKAGIDVSLSEMQIKLTSQSPSATVEIPIRILTTDNATGTAPGNVLSPDKIFNIVLSVEPDSLPDGFTLDPVGSRTDVAIRDNDCRRLRGTLRSEKIWGVWRFVLWFPTLTVRLNSPLSYYWNVTQAGTASELDYTRRAFDLSLTRSALRYYGR